MVVANFFKKNWLAIVTMIVTVGILIYFLISTNGISAFMNIAGDLKAQWIIAIFIAIIGMWALEGACLHMITLKIYKNWPLRYSLMIGMIGLLYGALTPFSSGGQAMQIYYMKKLGMDIGKSGAIIAVKTLVYQVVGVAFAMIMVFSNLSYFNSEVSNFAYITIIGLSANFLFVSGVLFFSFCPKATNKIIRFIVFILHKMKICKNPEEQYNKWTSGFAVFYESTKLMGRSFSVYIYTILITVVQLLCTFLIPYFVYRSFGLQGASPLPMIAAMAFTNMVSAFVPLPGASGGAELSFALYFEPFFKNNLLVPAIFVWRMCTYYFTIIVGACCTIWGSKSRKYELVLSDVMAKQIKSDKSIQESFDKIAAQESSDIEQISEDLYASKSNKK